LISSPAFIEGTGFNEDIYTSAVTTGVTAAGGTDQVFITDMSVEVVPIIRTVT